MDDKEYLELAKPKRSIPEIKGKKIVFRGEKTKTYSSLNPNEKTILKKKLKKIIDVHLE